MNNRELSRKVDIDVLKGILIILVVIGHSVSNPQIIFQFHMPLFFIISGLLFHKPEQMDRNFLARKTSRFLLPYFSWSAIMLLLNIDHFSVKQIAKILYGGRILTSPYGTWWFATCSLITLLAASFLYTHVASKVIAIVCIFFYCLGFIETAIVLQYGTIRFPWALDVCFISIPLFFIGLKFRNHQRLTASHKVGGVLLAVVFLVIFEFCIYRFDIPYVVDMKNVKYGNSVLFLPVVILWWILFRLLSQLALKSKVLSDVLGKFGILSYPIMFCHMEVIQQFNNVTQNEVLVIIGSIIFSFIVSYLMSKNKYLNALFITGNIAGIKNCEYGNGVSK